MDNSSESSDSYYSAEEDAGNGKEFTSDTLSLLHFEALMEENSSEKKSYNYSAIFAKIGNSCVFLLYTIHLCK